MNHLSLTKRLLDLAPREGNIPAERLCWLPSLENSGSISSSSSWCFPPCPHVINHPPFFTDSAVTLCIYLTPSLSLCFLFIFILIFHIWISLRKLGCFCFSEFRGFYLFCSFCFAYVKGQENAVFSYYIWKLYLINEIRYWIKWVL